MTKRLDYEPIRGNPRRHRGGTLTPVGGRLVPPVTPAPTQGAREHVETPEEPLLEEPSEAAGHEDHGEAARKPRLKITVQQPELVEMLCEEMGVSKAALFNLALWRLAKEEGYV